jgi:DNA-binding NarL/FixJ family response regulator
MTTHEPTDLIGVACVDLLISDLIVAELRRAGLKAVLLDHSEVANGPQVRVALLDLALLDMQPGLLNIMLRSGAKVLVLGAAESPAVISSLMAGASGAVDLEESTPETLISAITQVARGEASLHPAIAAAILDQWRTNSPSRGTPGHAPLSEREMEVLRAMGGGASARTVARSLGLSPKTVEAHKARIFDKLGVRGHAAAVRHAIDRGLITEEHEQRGV